MIPDECMSMFKTCTFNPISKRILEALIQTVNRDRAGEQIDRECIKNVIMTYKDMGIKKPATVLCAETKNLNWEGEKNLCIYME